MPNTSQNTEEPIEAICENTIALCINITTCPHNVLLTGVRQYLSRSLDNFKLIDTNLSLGMGIYLHTQILFDNSLQYFFVHYFLG